MMIKFHQYSKYTYCGVTFHSKKSSKSQKEAKRMVCDCSTSEEDRASGIEPCGDDCLNRMLMIEWYVQCTIEFKIILI